VKIIVNGRIIPTLRNDEGCVPKSVSNIGKPPGRGAGYYTQGKVCPPRKEKKKAAKRMKEVSFGMRVGPKE